MTGGGHGFRVSTIPSNVRKMIQNIKETGCNHSEEEIYAMLKECHMDPNETVQKLLLQDTFHEVKRKRDKKKENQNNRETVDTRWRSGPSGRFGRGGQGNASSHHTADAGGGKHSSSAIENGIKQSTEIAVSNSPASSAKEVKIKEKAEKASTSITSAKHTEVSSEKRSLGGATENVVVTSGAETISQHVQPRPSSSKSSGPATWTSGGHRSALDPVLVRSKDSRPPGAIGAIKHEIGPQRSHIEPNSNASAESKLDSAHENRSSSAHTKMGSKSHGIGKNQLAEFSRPSSSSGHSGSSSSRPSSNYGNRSQQAIGPPKGVSKEWKPKPTNSSNVLVSRTSPAPEQSSAAPEQSSAAPEQSSAAPEQFSVAPDQASAVAKAVELDHVVNEDVSGSEEPASKVEKELEGLHIKDAQHVIIPNHIHVPEAVRTSLTFGSFEAAVVVGTIKYSENTSESCQIEEAVVEQDISNDNVVAPFEEGDSINHQQPTHVPENASSIDSDVPSSSVSGIDNSKETSGFPQHPVVQASPAYSYPVVPVPVLENTEPFDNPDTQARDASRAPNFVMQQPMDPATANFYAQFYPSTEGDGRISPFHAHGVSTKHNGNAAFLSAQTSESTQEGGNPMAMSTTGQAPLANQAGLMPGTISMTQQAVPVFRQPPGLSMPHYPPNYIPYGHYFSPYYVPPPAIHQFLGNNAFLQQAQAGGVYPGPPTGATAGVKYPLAQFKPGSNSGNPTHMGIAASYGPYGTSPAGYNAGSTPGNSNANEDLAGSQYKENNVYTGGQQQTEGSAVWITAPGRDMSGLQANSFYNLPQQGQHVAFPPPQAGHGSFAGIYHHPGQAVTAANVHHPLLQHSQPMPGAADMVGPAPGSVYQQPQHASQMNWPNNY